MREEGEWLLQNKGMDMCVTEHPLEGVAPSTLLISLLVVNSLRSPVKANDLFACDACKDCA